MAVRSTPLFALGLKPDESLRLQAALERLLGYPVDDNERVADTVIAAVERIDARLTALEVEARQGARHGA